MGYCRAGFTEIVGVDIHPQPHYPFQFIQADALSFPLNGYDVIHASPPCQQYSVTRGLHGREHPDLLPAVRKRLQECEGLWVIENVIGAPIENGIVLCGSMFGLKIRRHRHFESNVLLFSPAPCQHQEGAWSITGHTVEYMKDRKRIIGTVEIAKSAMGINWMNGRELTQSIPPAYTEWVGRQLLEIL